MRFTGGITKVLAFASAAVCLLVSGESRADDPRVDWINNDGTHGSLDVSMWASCDAEGQDGYCTWGDNVYYQLNGEPNTTRPVVTVTPAATPAGYPPTSIAAGEVRWCSVQIQCHLGGGPVVYLYDEEQGETACHVDCADVGADLADEIWIAVGVSVYPP